MNVPDALLEKIVDEPSWNNEVDELWIGDPKSAKAVTFDPVRPSVVPVPFVNVSDPPWR